MRAFFYGVSDYAYEKSENLSILASYPYNNLRAFSLFDVFF